MKRLKPLPERWNGLRCARYLRCSNDEQAESEYSTIHAQDELTRRLVSERGGIDAGSYTDEGYTGTNLSRPDWRRLMADAAARQIDVVVATYMSRIGRGEAYIIAEHLLSEHGVRICLVQEKFGDDFAGYAGRSLQMLMDGMYPRMVSNWTKTKLHAMFRQGYWIGGRVPLGYRVIEAMPGTPKSPKAIEATAERDLVTTAFRLYAEGQPLAFVRDYLAAATGDEWTNHKTRNLLTSRFLLGEYHWGGMEHRTHHEAIVTPELWGAVAERVEDGRERRAAGREIRNAPEEARDLYSFPLRDRLYCVCGRPMVPSWGTSRHGYAVHYYQCRAKCPAAGDRLCVRVNASDLSASLVEEIGRTAAHPDRAAWQIRQAVERFPNVAEDYDARISSLEKRLREIGRGIDSLTSAVASASGRAAVPLLARIDAEEGKREQVAADLRRFYRERQAARWRPTQDQVAETLSLFTQIWGDCSDSQRAGLLTRIVQRGDLLGRSVFLADLNIGGGGVRQNAPRGPLRPPSSEPYPRPNPALSQEYPPVSRLPLLTQITRHGGTGRSTSGTPHPRKGGA